MIVICGMSCFVLLSAMSTEFGLQVRTIVEFDHWWPHSASFFASGIQKLVDRWNKCLNKFRRYVEKWNTSV